MEFKNTVGTEKAKYITTVLLNRFADFSVQFLLESFMVYSLILNIEQQVTSKFWPNVIHILHRKKATNKVVNFTKKVYTYSEKEEETTKKNEKKI